jgi:macrolide-specific efflux system membrane fusion protein
MAAIAIAAVAILILIQRKYFPLHPDAQLLTVPVTISDIELNVVANGTLQPKQLVSVGAQVSGQLRSLKVNLGERVTKNQLIAEIDPALAQNALRGSSGPAIVRADHAAAERQEDNQSSQKSIHGATYRWV